MSPPPPLWLSGCELTAACKAILLAPGRFSIMNCWPSRSCRDVSGSASRKADDNADRSRRIGLRPRDARDGRQRGSARCQMQKLAAGKFHGLLLCNVGDATLYSALILAAGITFAHLAVSDLMTTANSSGELRDTSRPSCACRFGEAALADRFLTRFG